MVHLVCGCQYKSRNREKNETLFEQKEKRKMTLCAGDVLDESLPLRCLLWPFGLSVRKKILERLNACFKRQSDILFGHLRVSRCLDCVKISFFDLKTCLRGSHKKDLNCGQYLWRAFKSESIPVGLPFQTGNRAFLKSPA